MFFLGDASNPNSRTLSCPWTFHDDEDDFHSLWIFHPRLTCCYSVCVIEEKKYQSIYVYIQSLLIYRVRRKKKALSSFFFGRVYRHWLDSSLSSISDSRPFTTVQSVRKIRRLLLLYSPSASSLSFFSFFFFFFFTCGDVGI